MITPCLIDEFINLEGFLYQMREASAVLILANRHCTNPDAEDAANIMR
jgi:hypothetical protein